MIKHYILLHVITYYDYALHITYNHVIIYYDYKPHITYITHMGGRAQKYQEAPIPAFLCRMMGLFFTPFGGLSARKQEWVSSQVRV